MSGSADGMVTVATPAAQRLYPHDGADRPRKGTQARLHKELDKGRERSRICSRNQLNNPKFVEKAPAKLVEETRAKLAAAQEKTAKIKESIAALG